MNDEYMKWLEYQDHDKLFREWRKEKLIAELENAWNKIKNVEEPKLEAVYEAWLFQKFISEEADKADYLYENYRVLGK